MWREDTPRSEGPECVQQISSGSASASQCRDLHSVSQKNESVQKYSIFFGDLFRNARHIRLQPSEPGFSKPLL